MISFKNTGISSNSNIFKKDVVIKPVGIKTPVMYSSENGFFETNDKASAQIKDNFRNLLLTNSGERLGRHSYGANLRRMVSELNTIEEFEMQVIESIRLSVTRYMPMIDLETFNAVYNNDTNIELKNIEMNISFNIPKLSIFDEKIDIRIYIM